MTDYASLFRTLYTAGSEKKSRTVSLIISEDDKDEMILGMNDTRFIKEMWIGGQFYIPCGFTLEGVKIGIWASYGIPSGVCVIE